MSDFQRIGVFAHPLRPQSEPLAHQIADTLRSRGIDAALFTQWDEADVRPHLPGLQAVIAIGGDGAMLRAGRVCAAADIPVLGINMGRLGFLTEVADPADWDTALDALLAGRYWIEQRMMLHAQVERDGSPVVTAESLNDIVISRSLATRMVQLEAYIDGGWTTTYHADALILSTATGSTAYALASGGPILPPDLRNLLLVPVAPHLSLDRPIVLQEGAVVSVVVQSETDTVMTADGATVAALHQGDRVIVHASDNIARFLRLRERSYFYRSLLDRLEPRLPQSRAPAQEG